MSKQQKQYTFRQTQFGWGVWCRKRESFVHSWTGAEAKKNAIKRAKQLNEGE